MVRMRVSVGYVAVAAIVAALAGTAAVVAKNDAKYIGSGECVTCHSDTHPAIIKAYPKTLHRAAMVDVAKNPKAITPSILSLSKNADCPFKKAQIKYVLGIGRSYQNYLDKNLKLLPGKWDAVAKKWEKIEPVDGATQCVGCHVTNFNPKTKTWTELGVGCECCHGPGSVHADSMEAKDITNLKKLASDKLDMVCGQCHAQGTDLTGKYAFSTTFRPGDDLSKHFKLKEPVEGAPNSQYNQFIKSKHAVGGIIKCTTCHDTHGDKAKAEHQLRQPVNQMCLGCHSVELGDAKAVTSLQEHAPTAKPDDTCATCHMVKGSHTFKAM